MQQVTVLGTGTMGTGISHSLQRAGFAVTVWNRTHSKAEHLAEDGIAVAETVEQGVADADVVITTLFDAEAVMEVAVTMLPAMKQGATWMQSATIGQRATAAAARQADQHEVAFVDAPVLGTKGPAEAGTLTVLASGDPAAVAALEPVFDAIASTTVIAGDKPGAGSGLKLACNTWIASLTAGTAQALSLAKTFGVDPQLFLTAIRGTASDSPYAHTKGSAMLAGTTSDAQFELLGLLKDLRLAESAATDSGLHLDLLTGLIRTFTHAAELGAGHDDISAVISGITGRR